MGAWICLCLPAAAAAAAGTQANLSELSYLLPAAAAAGSTLKAADSSLAAPKRNKLADFRNLSRAIRAVECSKDRWRWRQEQKSQSIQLA